MVNLPNRVYVAAVNRSVAVFPTKSAIPTGFGEQYAAIPEDGMTATDIASRQGIITLGQGTPSVGAYAGIGRPGVGMGYDQYMRDMSLELKKPGLLEIFWAWLFVNAIKIIGLIAALITVLYLVTLTFSTTVTKIDDTHYYVTSPWGSGTYDTSTDSFNQTSTGLTGILNTVVEGVVVVAVVGVAAYAVVKWVIPALSKKKEAST